MRLEWRNAITPSGAG